MPHINIAKFENNQDIEEIFILNSHSVKMTKTGSTYMTVELRDGSGVIKGNLWTVPAGLADMLTDGDFVKAAFHTEMYKGAMQANIDTIQNVHPAPADMEGVVPISAEDPELLYAEILEESRSLKAPYGAMILDAFAGKYHDLLMKSPAAKSMHHAEIGGLLQHTVEVLRTAKAIAAVYKAYQPVDEDLLYTAVILHDFGKIWEFTPGPTGLVADYSKRGNLLGHIYMGAEFAASLARKNGLDPEHTLLLQHLILSHHGKLEYGSPEVPKTVEAFILHEADDISAKYHEIHDALKPVEPGEFSDPVFALGNARLYKPLPYPAEDNCQ